MRQIRLDSSSEEDDYRETGSRRRRNTELVIVTWLFTGMFVLLSGYLVWFQIIRKPSIENNVYNTKQDAAAGNVIRGDIVTESGEQLAATTVDYTGNEVRSYPYGRMFAHLVGYATNGRSGLEAYCNTDLMSTHSSLLSRLQDAEDPQQKEKGDTVVVTLSPKLQQAAWYALGDYRGAVVILEPDTGRILAMVSKPDFDPNTIAYDWDYLMSDESSGILLNRATQGLYPPGSIFKILTTLAYLQEHQDIYEDYQFDCQGIVTKNDVTITCYHQIVHGAETLRSAFANSCNTAFATIGIDLSNSSFRKLSENFLFNQSLPLELPHSKSVFALKKDSSVGEQMTTAIGQGDTLVTPLHMAMIAATVANAGTMMKPWCVSRVVAEDGTVISETKPEIYDEMMSVEEAAIIGSFMEETVLSGTGTALYGNGYSVAGKTGSAEYDTGSTSGTHSWFIGYSGTQDPQLAIAVIAEDGGTGSSTAVPIVKQILDVYYYG